MRRCALRRLAAALSFPIAFCVAFALGGFAGEAHATAYAQTIARQPDVIAPAIQPIGEAAAIDAGGDAAMKLVDAKNAAIAAQEEEKKRAQEAQAAAVAKKSASSSSSSSTSSSSSASSATATSTSSNSTGATYTPCTLTIGGSVISYVDAYNSPSAPSSGAGVWKGSDSTTDASFGYFIGHNPGSFAVVMGLGVGSSVRVCDSNGNTRSYSVVKVMDVPRTSTWGDISSEVLGRGESVTLQTCNGDSYRIVIAT